MDDVGDDDDDDVGGAATTCGVRGAADSAMAFSASMDAFANAEDSYSFALALPLLSMVSVGSCDCGDWDCVRD